MMSLLSYKVLTPQTVCVCVCVCGSVELPACVCFSGNRLVCNILLCVFWILCFRMGALVCSHNYSWCWCVFVVASVMSKGIVSHRLGDWTQGEHTHTHTHTPQSLLTGTCSTDCTTETWALLLQSGAVNGLISQLVVYKCSVVWFQSSVSVDVGLRSLSVVTNVEHWLGINWWIGCMFNIVTKLRICMCWLMCKLKSLLILNRAFF